MSDHEITEFLDGVIGVVEATSCEKSFLWKQYTEELKIPFEEKSFGLGRIVGYLDDMPVFISLLIAAVDGHKVLFMEATSQVVDYRLIDKWLNENCPKTAFCGDRLNKVDALNFHNVFPRGAAVVV